MPRLGSCVEGGGEAKVRSNAMMMTMRDLEYIIHELNARKRSRVDMFVRYEVLKK